MPYGGVSAPKSDFRLPKIVVYNLPRAGGDFRVKRFENYRVAGSDVLRVKGFKG